MNDDAPEVVPDNRFGPDQLAEYRALAEWRFYNQLDDTGRANVRSQADLFRSTLQQAGLDPLDPDNAAKLWLGWLSTVSLCQHVLDVCCPEDQMHVSFHALQAVHYSGVVTLLITEPNIPDPETR